MSKQRRYTEKEWGREKGLKKLREDHAERWATHKRKMILALINKHPKICDVGCGNGRAAYEISSKRYIGVDINPLAVQEAQKLHPEHIFRVISWGSKLPTASLYMFVNVLLHISDDEIQAIIQPCIEDRDAAVLVIESMCRCLRWRSVWHARDREEYEALFAQQRYRKIAQVREQIKSSPYFIDYCLFTPRG